MRLPSPAFALLLTGLLVAGSAPSAAQGPSAGVAALLEASVDIAAAKDPETAKIGRDLTLLYQELDAHRRGKRGEPFASDNPLLPLRGEGVVIDAVAATGSAKLRGQLEKLGLEDAAVAGRVVSGTLPISALPLLARLDNLRFARPAYAATRAGLVTSQGDAAMFADVARADFGVDGTGVSVGVLSDSFDCLNGARFDLVTGDLPAELEMLEILREGPDCAAATDEGRAMMQIVHDVAPGARQLFHTAFTGQAGFAQGIRDLAAAGARVIVDDVIYFAEPMFQDGVIAQAVDEVAADGVAYFSAAGNSGRLSYSASFVPSGQVFAGGALHAFAPGDVTQSLTLPVGLNVITLQWKDRYFSNNGSPGSRSDLDIFLLDGSGTQILGGSFDDNVGGDPIEVLGFFNPGPETLFNIAIIRFSPPGTDPELMQHVVLNGTINEYDSAASTLYGHANAAGAVAVGAAPYNLTPGFGVEPAFAEEFSARGGTPILFSRPGDRIFEVRHKPEIVCPDGVNTTFFGFDADGDGFPNFFGTSAAAPHAAAVAALLLELDPDLSPAGVRNALESTAGDMYLAGFDFDTGYGFCLADQALASLSMTEACVEDLANGIACLYDERFELSMTWADGEAAGPAIFEKFSHQAAVGTFDNPNDPTILVKVTDGCSAGDYWSMWIGGASASAGWELAIRDTETGQVEEYSKAAGEEAETVVDDGTFPCP